MNKLLTTLSAFAVACVTTASLLGASMSAHAQDAKGDAKAGQSKIAMCIGCHGIVGYQASFPEVYKVPKISGQSAKYIVSALNAYKKGERKHPTMRGISDSLSDQDMADVAAYYSAHGVVEGATLAAKPSKEPSTQVDALLKKGGCVACHGENFAKPIDPTYPKIAGQHADYLFVTLKAYKTENNPQVGRSNGVMAGMAKQFSNNELKEMSKYISSLDGDLKTVPQAKFR
ncbi:MAG: c-type cytochrome [Burkholderiaceae bacterium]|nr:c-type cytochrome [Burkholderiaceae bacterium]